MGQTPELGLPYPEYTDDTDVPKDLKNLATAIDQLLSTTPQTDHPIQVIDPGPASQMQTDWTDFPLGSVSGRSGFSGPNKDMSWDTAPVLNPESRWRYTAPADGILQVHASFHIGHNHGHDCFFDWTRDTIWQQFRLMDGTMVGNVQSIHPTYAIWRYDAWFLDFTDIIDTTINLTEFYVVEEGSVVSPYIIWRGTVDYEGWWSRVWQPKWTGGRMKGLFIPGLSEVVTPPSNPSSARDNATNTLTRITAPDPLTGVVDTTYGKLVP